jgi:predicted NBD/HSP70 family sugar kinase
LEVAVTELSAARPPLIRAMNEQLLLGHIRTGGPCSRADLARISGLSKPTVSLALANLERAGLVRAAGQRTGLPGRTALLYEIRPDAGFVLGLDIGLKYLRGAVADLTGAVRARGSRKAAATSVRGRIAELVQLADELCEQAGTTRQEITQTVIGTPGIYDPKRNAITLTGGLAGWDKPSALDGLRDAFGPALALENDVDAAALAERTHGYGRDMRTFAWVHVGTGIGMGLVLDGKLHRGAHGVAGEIAFMPLGDPDSAEARRRGPLETAAAAAGIVRAARLAGIRGPVSARRVFAAAARGDERAAAVVANEARLVANAICCVITVMDPELVVLGGGIGQAPGFAEAVTEALRGVVPVLPEVRVTALGSDVVVDGCLAEGASLAWNQLTSDLLSGQAAE